MQKFGREVRLQGSHGHTPIGAGIHLIARMGAAHRALGRGQAPVPGQGQVACRIFQRHLVKHAFAVAAARFGPLPQGFQHGFAGLDGPGHVGKQCGGQGQASHQAIRCQIGQVVAGDFRARAGRTHNADHVQGRELGVQVGPGHAEFLQGRRAKRGQQHVGLGQELVQLGLAFGGFQVGLHHFHTRVKLGISVWGVQPHGVRGRAFGRTGGRQRFEFAALGAHGGQAHQGGGPGQVQRHAQDANALEAAVGLLEIGLCHGVLYI